MDLTFLSPLSTTMLQADEETSNLSRDHCVLIVTINIMYHQPFEEIYQNNCNDVISD